MNTHEAKMFHWNTSDLGFALNHLRCAEHFVEFQQPVFDAVLPE